MRLNFKVFICWISITTLFMCAVFFGENSTEDLTYSVFIFNFIGFGIISLLPSVLFLFVLLLSGEDQTAKETICIEHNPLYDSLDLYGWLLRCPNGSMQLGKHAWIEVKRPTNNVIDVFFTTHKDHSTREYGKAFSVVMDKSGVIDVFYQIRELHLLYSRNGEGYKSQESIDKASVYLEKLRVLFVNNGNHYYNRPFLTEEDVL